VTTNQTIPKELVRNTITNNTKVIESGHKAKKY